MTDKQKGTVKFFNDTKGFGFITGEDSEEYFVHISGILNQDEITQGDQVTFNVVDGDRGKKAENVALA